MSGIGDLVAHLVADTSQWSGGLNKAQGDMDKFSSSIASQLNGLVMQYASVGFAIGLAQQAFQEATQENLANQKLDAVLEATGHAAGLSGDEIRQMARELQGVSQFSDEATVSASAVLATFKEIKGDHFKEAIRAAQDMSVVMGQDLKASVVQLGKALNDPIKGVSALSEVGVSFTQQQRDQIKAMTLAGDVAGAQAVILRELESEFGGAAEATVTAADKIGHAWGDALEKAGNAVIPFADLAVTGLDAVSAKSAELQVNLLKFAPSAGPLGTLLTVFLGTKTAVEEMNAALDDTPEKLKAIVPGEGVEAATTFDLGVFADEDAELSVDKDLKKQLASAADELAILRGEATKADIALRKLMEEGLSAEDVAPLKEIQGQIEAQKKLAESRKRQADFDKQMREEKRREEEKLEQQAESIRQSVLTDEEKAIERREHLQELLDAGKITQEVFDRATAAPEEKGAEAGAVGALQKGSADALSAVFKAMRGEDIPKKQLAAQEETNERLVELNKTIEARSDSSIAIYAGTLEA